MILKRIIVVLLFGCMQLYAPVVGEAPKTVWQKTKSSLSDVFDAAVYHIHSSLGKDQAQKAVDNYVNKLHTKGEGRLENFKKNQVSPAHMENDSWLIKNRYTVKIPWKAISFEAPKLNVHANQNPIKHDIVFSRLLSDQNEKVSLNVNGNSKLIALKDIKDPKKAILDTIVLDINDADILAKNFPDVFKDPKIINKLIQDNYRTLSDFEKIRSIVNDDFMIRNNIIAKPMYIIAPCYKAWPDLFTSEFKQAVIQAHSGDSRYTTLFSGADK